MQGAFKSELDLLRNDIGLLPRAADSRESGALDIYPKSDLSHVQFRNQDVHARAEPTASGGIDRTVAPRAILNYINAADVSLRT